MGRPKEYNRDDLLNKTVQLFWRKGLADTSLADLEKATGVNKSGLYSEFKDKDDLFTESLRHYIDTNGVMELLSREPLGKENILDFLLFGKVCTNARGCFAVNSVRESAIIPNKAKEIIAAHLQRVSDKLILNIKASKYSGDAKICADMILTFNAGICLEQNAQANDPTKKIKEFFKLMNF